ncbi:hypothetical protein ACPS97_003695 [Providencia rettgeri]|uniref:hypothetical protein n=1 Tax=Providencia TaxID=586 RepID=UPI00234BA381|nr:hypothetical protein [Providencia sp. PROV157]ELM3939780.1 hypothetical protein [Providencia rettgeri]EMA4647407.1 hypothetical protein [Providencia rettgeri]WRR95973.1 hypothetical protein VNI59_14550 [Providencia rettgeri]
MKFIINCPVCQKDFDARTPAMHIRQHHKQATDAQLMLIRNARREVFRSQA